MKSSCEHNAAVNPAGRNPSSSRQEATPSSGTATAGQPLSLRLEQRQPSDKQPSTNPAGGSQLQLLAPRDTKELQLMAAESLNWL